MAPLVTVLMPVHDARRYVDAAVASVLAQSFRDFELSILDDGSTDGTSERIARLASKDARIRWVRRENRGLVATLNEGLAAVRSPFVARMDADDVASPDRLARQLEHLERHPACVCVGGAVELVDEADRPLYRIALPTDHATLDALHLQGHTSIVHPAAMMRTDVVRTLGYREELVLAEDLDLWLRLAEVGEIHNVPETVLAYRRHGGSTSGRKAREQLAAARRACESAYVRRGVAGTFTVDRHWLPTEDRESRLRYALETGWCAFLSGHRRTAVAYGLEAVAAAPLAPAAWKLLALAPWKPIPKGGFELRPLPT